MADKPEGYPYTAVRLDAGGYFAVVIDWSPSGFPQITDHAQWHDERVEAKRDAVRLAEQYGCHFKTELDLGHG